MKIKRLRRGDQLVELFELSRQFFEEYALHDREFFKIDQLHQKDITEYFARFVDADDRAAFVSVADGQIIGYITVRVQPQPDYWQIKRVGCISGLMVHRDYRRRGIGRALLRRAIRFLAEKEIPYLTVYTAAGNQAAIEFYQRSGMAPLYTTMLYRVDQAAAGTVI